MRRAAVVITALALAATGCSSTDERASTAAPAAPTGPVPTSRQFDQPFPVAGADWDATVTVSGPRLTSSSDGSGWVFAVDTRSVQSSGQPVIDPADFRAHDPSGRQFERIDYPKGIVVDPLVRTTITAPGQSVSGTVAWTVPEGARIGRVDLVTPRTIASLTVTRQPEAPSSGSASR